MKQTNLGGLSPAEVRDHIEMVDRILAESSRRLYAGGEYFVVWGLGSACITLILFALPIRGQLSTGVWLAPLVIAACTVFTVLRNRLTCKWIARSSLIQREFFNVLWLTMALALVVDLAGFRIFRGIAMSAIWSFAAAIVLFYIGTHGNRRAQAGGILVVASLIAANFVDPALSAYVLAAGMVVGYAGFGVAELLLRD